MIFTTPNLASFARILAHGGAAILLVAGAWMRLSALPAAPFFEWDTRGWLEPALNWLDGSGFRENCEREWLYGAFLASCLKIGGSFEFIVWCQWALGLVGGLFLWFTWRLWSGMLPESIFVRCVSVVLGWLALAAYILNPNIIVFEMSLRPEAILGVAVLTAMFIATRYVKARWQSSDNPRLEWWGIFLPTLAGAIVTLKPSWALSFPIFIAPLLLGCIGPGNEIWKNSRPLLLGGLLAVAGLILPEKLLFQREEKARVVLPMTLLTIHAHAVIPALKAELEDPATPPDRREVLASALPVLERDFAASQNVPIYYPRLGFDPDYIMYRGALFPHLVSSWSYTNAELAKFCNRAFVEAWRREPILMASKVVSQLDYFAFPDARTYSKSKASLHGLAAESLKVAGENFGEQFGAPIHRMCRNYLENLREKASLDHVLRAWRPLDEFLRKRVPPVIWVAMIALAIACLSAGWKAMKPLRIPAALSLFYLAIPAANALTVALIHALDNNRYRMSYGPVVFFAICSVGALAFAAAYLAIKKIRSGS